MSETPLVLSQLDTFLTEQLCLSHYQVAKILEYLWQHRQETKTALDQIGK